jgi:hypothetical protein
MGTTATPRAEVMRGGCGSEAWTPGRRGAGYRGFSLVELTVGVLLLEVGVLALVATAGGIVRMTLWGGREGGSALVAGARFEALRGSVCESDSGAASGAAREGPYDERWTVAVEGTARAVRLDVSFGDGRRTRTVRFETVVECAP